MNIVHVASEIAPIAKIGGLGDMVYGLAKAEVKKGNDVRVFLPKYDGLDIDELEGIKLTLIESPYFERGKIYGEEDDNDRFLYFCSQVCKCLENEQVDMVHLHDWQAAGCSFILKQKKIFTIHNLEYQGRCTPHNLEKAKIPFNEEELSDPTYENTLNLMKGAFGKCDKITVVSPSYAKEILTPEYGFGLEGVLEKNKEKLTGILNGIDAEYWNPKTDPHLPCNFDLETVEIGKLENKLHIQKRLGLKKDPDVPLVVAITRLVSQKGPDLIRYGMEKTAELGGQFALLGAVSDPEIKELFENLNHLENISLHFEYDEPLSHMLYAGSDMLLMPSIFEPCGLAQMIALRYGSIPLVRSTGGLKDTIFEGKNGFCFTTPDNSEISKLLERAFESFAKKKQWQGLIKTGMETDFSWESSAEKYLSLLR